MLLSMDPVTLPSLPMPLRWLGEPAQWSVGDDGGLSIGAGPATDWFVDPQGQSDPVLNAPALLGVHDGDFVLSARVEVGFAATYDAGVLALYGDERTWAKLCLEYSPQANPMVVSVVTRGVSDDCNSTLVDGNRIWLRIARLGRAVAFHSSPDGEVWQLVRHFRLETPDPQVVGFQTQSPTGEGCTASFSAISFTRTPLADLRDGG